MNWLATKRMSLPSAMTSVRRGQREIARDLVRDVRDVPAEQRHALLVPAVPRGQALSQANGAERIDARLPRLAAGRAG